MRGVQRSLIKHMDVLTNILLEVLFEYVKTVLKLLDENDVKLEEDF